MERESRKIRESRQKPRSQFCGFAVVVSFNMQAASMFCWFLTGRGRADIGYLILECGPASFTKVAQEIASVALLSISLGGASFAMLEEGRFVTVRTQYTFSGASHKTHGPFRGSGGLWRAL